MWISDLAGMEGRNRMYDVSGTTLTERHEQSSLQYGTFRKVNACTMIIMLTRLSTPPSISSEHQMQGFIFLDQSFWPLSQIATRKVELLLLALQNCEKRSFSLDTLPHPEGKLYH